MANNYRLRVSRTGANALTDSIRLMTVDSTVNMLKIHMEGYATQAVTTGVVANINIDHNLGYKPIVYFFFKHPQNNKWHFAPARADFNTGTTWDLYGAWNHQSVNRVQLQLYDSFTFPMPSSPTNINYKYYILVDPQKDAWFN